MKGAKLVQPSRVLHLPHLDRGDVGVEDARSDFDGTVAVGALQQVVGGYVLVAGGHRPVEDTGLPATIRIVVVSSGRCSPAPLISSPAASSSSSSFACLASIAETSSSLSAFESVGLVHHHRNLTGKTLPGALAALSSGSELL